MAFEYTPPKYAQIIAELQERIESGEYPAGSLLPSEHQLSMEFGTARPTVVRALRELRQGGWIDTQQGKGSFVRGRPALAESGAGRRGAAELDRDEAREPGELLSAGTVTAPPRIAAMLGVKPGAEVLSRRRLIRREGEASEVLTWWLPPAIGDGTGIGDTASLRGGLRSVLAKAKGIRIDYIVERVSARQPEGDEAKLLGITRTAPVLAVYVTACQADGSAVLAMDIAMPGDLHELEDAYPVG